MPDLTCRIDGCDGLVRARGLCGTHYNRWRAVGDSFADKPIRAYGTKHCSVEGCDKPHHALGLCRTHHSRAEACIPLDVPVRRKTPPRLEREQSLSLHSEPNNSGCIIWTGPIVSGGYGAMSVNGDQQLAHRAAWEVSSGQAIPDGMVIRHSCDNPPCVNPEHLSLGSYADNSRDMVKRKRNKYGERVHTAVLKEEEVLKLRRLSDDGWSYNMLAEKFGISKSTVYAVVKRKSWKHLH